MLTVHVSCCAGERLERVGSLQREVRGRHQAADPLGDHLPALQGQTLPPPKSEYSSLTHQTRQVQ